MNKILQYHYESVIYGYGVYTIELIFWILEKSCKGGHYLTDENKELLK